MEGMLLVTRVGSRLPMYVLRDNVVGWERDASEKYNGTAISLKYPIFDSTTGKGTELFHVINKIEDISKQMLEKPKENEKRIALTIYNKKNDRVSVRVRNITEMRETDKYTIVFLKNSPLGKQVLVTEMIGRIEKLQRQAE